MKRRSLLLAPALVLVLALGACGSDSGSDTSGGGSATTATTATTGGEASAKAREACLEQAKKISNETARSAAEQACNDVTGSGGQVDQALTQAKEACVENANKIPVDALKQQALDACDKIQ